MLPVFKQPKTHTFSLYILTVKKKKSILPSNISPSLSLVELVILILIVKTAPFSCRVFGKLNLVHAVVLLMCSYVVIMAFGIVLQKLGLQQALCNSHPQDWACSHLNFLLIILVSTANLEGPVILVTNPRHSWKGLLMLQ